MEKFRLRSRDIGLTYSQCNVDKEEVLKHLFHLLPKATYICVSQETHKDGFPHLHSQVQLSRETDILNERFFDYAGFHPNIIKTIDSSQWNTYIKKDGNFSERGTFEQLRHRSKKRQKIDNKRLLEGNIQEMIENNEISLYSLPGLLNARLKYQEITKSTLPDLPSELPLNWECNGFPLNLKVFPLSEKKRHYWLWSDEPNLGKSTYLQKLSSMYRASFYACQEKFQSLKEDSQLVLFDEYAKGNSVKATDLNQMCDGTYKYPRKGSPAILLNKPYLIICSNYSIDSVYIDEEIRKRIKARFNEVCLDLYTFVNGEFKKK